MLVSELVDMRTKNMFNLIGDDEAVLIFQYLARVDHGGVAELRDLGGTAYRKRVLASVNACGALASTCRYLHQLLGRVNEQLQEELKARRTLDVRPLLLWQTLDLPYQHMGVCITEETAMIKLLRKGETNLCFHCGGKHCKLARGAVAAHGADVCGICNHRVYNLSACRGGANAFLAARVYMGNTPRDVIQYVDRRGVVLDEQAPPWFNIEGCSPNLMAAHPGGLACAYTCELETDINALCLVTRGRIQRIQGIDASHYDDPQGDIPWIKHAQGIWWRQHGDEWQLCVAWSTTLVAGSGHDMHGGAPVTADERFVISTYRYDDESKILYAEEHCGPYYGRLLTCKATAGGDKVACHVRRRPLNRWDTHYVAMAIDLRSTEAAEAKHPSIWKCNGKRRMGKDGFDWGPSAVGISPQGDALVCVHRTPGGVVMEVLDHDDGCRYTTTNSRDLTEYFTTASYGVEDFEALFESESSDSESEEEYPNKVKLPFDVEFTTSGSRVCLTDRRPQFGSRAARYTTVLVDISKRRHTKLMKALPLYQERGSAAKGLHWGSHSVWVQARRGVVRLARN